MVRITKTNGAVVQLVRITACHAVGRGFESRPHRSEKKKAIRRMALYFKPISFEKLAFIKADWFKTKNAAEQHFLFSLPR